MWAWVSAMAPSLSCLPPGPPHGGLSLQQSRLHLSLRTAGVRKQKLPAFLKARLETRSRHISLLSAGPGQPQIQRMEEWIPSLSGDGHRGKGELVAALCGDKHLSWYRGRKGRRKTSHLLLLFVIAISVFSSSCPSKSASARGRHMS